MQKWHFTHHLSVNPSKAELVVYTRKAKLDGFKRSTLSGQRIQETHKVKYLRVHPNSKLTWKDHVGRKKKKAIATQWACKRAFEITWTLTLQVINWLCTMIVRPMLTYDAVVCCGLETATVKKSITQNQRLACVEIKIKWLQRNGVAKELPNKLLTVRNKLDLCNDCQAHAILRCFGLLWPEDSDSEEIKGTSSKINLCWNSQCYGNYTKSCLESLARTCFIADSS